MAYDFKGPGVARPHPKKNWVNPDAKQVAYGSAGKPRRERGPTRDPVGPSRDEGPSRDRVGRSLAPVQIFAALMGLAFLLAGLGGFIPKVTTMYSSLETYGLDSKAELLGLFRVSILHNIVHLLFAVGLLAALRAASARLYLLAGGVIYLGVAAYGYLVDHASDANFLPINDADTYLHVGLSLAMIVLGVLGTLAGRRTASTA